MNESLVHLGVNLLGRVTKQHLQEHCEYMNTTLQAVEEHNSVNAKLSSMEDKISATAPAGQKATAQIEVYQ
jgi:hypothetical protein